MSQTRAPSKKQKAALAKSRQMRKALEWERKKLERDLITPEGAALTLKLASAGERAGALFIDLLLIILIAFVSLFGLGYIAGGMGFRGAEIAVSIAMVFIFLLRNFYFVVFEIGRRAATPGKRALGLRVAARNGGQLTANAVFARNFTRDVEVFLPIQLLMVASAVQDVDGWVVMAGLIWSGLFMFFPVFNADKLRAGDIIAGTWVIHAPKVKLLGDISRTDARTGDLGGFNFTSAQIDTYGIHELHVLEDVLRKSSPEVKASVAERIRGKIGWTVSAGETDRAFLEAYYGALRRHLEQKLLLGKRKADKFDKG